MAKQSFVARLASRASRNTRALVAATALVGTSLAPIVGVGAGVAHAARKDTGRRHGPPAPAGASFATEADIQGALDAQMDAIQRCASSAVRSTDNPFDVSAQVMVNNFGQVLGAQVNVGLPGTHAAEVRSCVQSVLMQTAFPHHGSPLISLSRTWTFNAR